MNTIIRYNDSIIYPDPQSVLHAALEGRISDLLSFLNENFADLQATAIIDLTGDIDNVEELKKQLTFLGSKTEPRDKVFPALYDNGFAEYITFYNP